MFTSTDEILTIKEVATFLKVAERTVYMLAQSARLPGFKVGGQWRFRRSDLDNWIEQQKITQPKEMLHGKKTEAQAKNNRTQRRGRLSSDG